MEVLLVAGARPNFMKVAPILEACRAEPRLRPVLVHTGQHYDERMSRHFFRDLGIPEPAVNLGVGSASHAVQTAEIMRAFEPVLLERRPGLVVVVGDVNSTVACGLVAVKLGVPLAHVEAGLRSFDRTMPEEINRLVTDAISDLLFCTEASGVENLRREGVAAERVHLVGHVMVDTLLRHRERAEESAILERLGLGEGSYAVLTLHRPANVDDPATLGRILDALAQIQQELPVVFPVHPRTRSRLEAGEWGPRVAALAGLRLLEPLGYLDFLKLMSRARLVLTDSGGIQEETTILRVPCLTLRENTERPVTLECGTNRLVGMDPARILEGFRWALAWRPGAARVPPLWDGRAAERIVAILAAR